MNILIIEANTPDMVARGHAGAAGFVASFQGLAAEVTCTIVNPYAGQEVVLDGVDGVVFTGSGVAWSTDAPEAAPQRAAMEAVFAAGLPSWGSCNGMQLGAVILGGAVGASPKGFEVGVAQGTQRVGGAHPMFAGRGDLWAVPCIHRDEVQRLPEGAVHTAQNDHSPIQGFAYTQNGVDFWGAQYHPELRPTDIATYLRASDGIFAERADLIADLDRAEENESAAERIGTSRSALALGQRAMELSNWLAHVKTRAANMSI